MATTVVSITTLSPASAPPADAAIRAVVTLIWPYSSSTQQCALLLADPDFRLRNKKGQVRVRFSGTSAEAVALGKLGIGDEVLLELKGAEWAESVVRTPGKSVDGELNFEGEVALQKVGGEWIRASGNRQPPARDDVQTPVARNRARVELLRSSLSGLGEAIPIYSSPAFVRISRLSGDGYDPFTGVDDDLEAEGPRKRARISFGGVEKWRLAGRSPSPEKEDRIVQVVDADVDMEEEDAPAEESNDVGIEEEITRPAPRVVDFAPTSAMAPPPLTRLHIPQASSSKEGPTTPTLKPIPSSALPLPSPFPTEPQRVDLIAERHTPEADSLSTTASTSQPSLAFTQSLPDTADPDDDDDDDGDIPTGIYAHNGTIEGTYREHMAHPELLSDTEEDEGMYDEHLRVMQEVARRDECQYTDVDEEDAEEVIEDIGEEPGESSDMEVADVEDEDAEAEVGEDQVAEVKSASRAPSVFRVDSDTLDEIMEDFMRQNPASPVSKAAAKIDQAASNLLPTNEIAGTQPLAAAPEPVPTKIYSVSESHSRKRKASPAPQTPAKLPAGIFGLDGASSNTPQSTPQSERDRIMARTYSSLFGFGTPSAALQPFVQTPTPSGGMEGTARVEAVTGSAVRSGFEETQSRGSATAPHIETPASKASQVATAEERQTSIVSETDGVGVRGTETSAGEVVPAEDVMMADAQNLLEMGRNTIEDRPAVRADDNPAAVHVIDLGSSDGEESDEATAEEPEQLPQDGAVEVEDDVEGSAEERSQGTTADDIDAPKILTYPGSPTEVDSESDDADLQHLHEPLAQASAEEEEVEPVKDHRGRVIPETLQTLDAQSIHPEEGFFANQMHTGDDSQMPATGTRTKHHHSFHYFSFQSETTAANESFAGERKTTPTAHKVESEVIELSSSSPVAEAEADSADNAVPHVNAPALAVDEEDEEQMSDAEAFSLAVAAREDVAIDANSHSVEEDQQMSDAEAFSPEQSSTHTGAFDTEKSLHVKAADIEEVSHAAEDDEDISDAEAFSPETSAAQQSSLDTSQLQVDDSLAAHASEAQSHVEHSMLPLSPDESQSFEWESQLPPPDRSALPQAAPQLDQLNQDIFPPTPQLTQGDSLIKETAVVEAAEARAATPDPPSMHTRSNVDLSAVGVVPLHHLTPGPPSRHTQSSADSAVVEGAETPHLTPDPPSRHTRSSAEPTRHVTPDPPSRRARSSAEPTTEKKLQSPIQKTPARKPTRKSQTPSQAMGEIVEERKLEEQEDEDTIAVLSPLQKTPVRKSPRKISQAPAHDTSMDEPEQAPQTQKPAKKSLTSRLSNVPDVISAWFSPRRSTRLHPDEEGLEDEDEPKKPASTGVSTALGYYTPLSNLNQKMNSQARAENTVDLIAVVSDSTKEPERAKTGPRDYFTCFKMWDTSLGPEMSVFVEVFRPWKAKLPMAEVGDVIMLRGFTVKSRKREPYLISSETSGWCVWRYAEYWGADGRKGKKRTLSFSSIKEEVKGPPVELGNEERNRARELREAWEKMD